MRLEDARLSRARLPAVPVAWRAPFALDRCYASERPAGESLLEIVRSVPDLPRDFLRRGVVCINGEVVPRELWPHVRPKPTRAEIPIAVTLHYALGSPGGGGGGSSAKAIGSIVAAFALIVLTYGAASGFIGGLLGIEALGAGTIGAKVLAGAIGIVGALAISALSAPPTAQAGGGPATSSVSENNADQKEAAAATGNLLDRGGAVPRVIGTRKVFPPLACEPIVELVGEDEFVEALFVLNGPHQLEDIRIDNVAAEDSDDVAIETREGWNDDLPLSSIIRQGRTITPQVELSFHQVNPVSQTLLADPVLPDKNLPVWHGLASRNAPDEIWLHLLLPQGLSSGGSANEIAMPFRIRMRRRGDSAWINLPEFHLAGATLQQLRRAVQIKWKGAEPLQSVPASGGFYLAYGSTPGQTAAVGAITDPWIADSYFVESGNAYLYSGVEASTGLKNLNLFANRVEFYLDEATFPKGVYEIQVKRGAVYTRSSFTPSTYTYSASIRDFFSYQNVASPSIPLTRANLADRIIATRLVSIWNEAPVQALGFAQIAMRARNRPLQNISVRASGFVRDWNEVDGTWSEWTTTSNPAPHYADVLSGAQNLDPLPADLRDDDGLVAWRADCIDNDWTCDAIINDMRTQDALALLASCGYGRPYQSDVYGIIVDKDRSSDSPVQIFSRRNSNNMRIDIAFPRVPAGLNVTYRDEAADDDQAQLIVYQRDQSLVDPSLIESVSYEGLTDAAKVRVRAQFDLDQATERATFYQIDTDVESIVCRRGDLIGLQHDLLTARAGDGYIATVKRAGGFITGVILDAEIPISNVGDMHAVTDMHEVTDMHDIGIVTGIVIRHTDGSESTHELADVGDGKDLTFATPVADSDTIQGFDENSRQYGCHVVAGKLGAIYRRLIVQAIAPNKDLTATLTLVDEAPGLVRYPDLTTEDGVTPLESEDGIFLSAG